MSDNQCRIIVIVPVFNEATVIAEVVDEIKSSGAYSIIVVDDGSRDNTCQIIRQLNDIVSIRHKINRGKGAAVKTAMEAAKRLDADVVITMDGDGQHDPSDLYTLIAPILKDGYDVVLGSRMLNHEGMPKIKVVANYIGNFFTLFFYGIWVSDSQSGFRAFSKYAVSVIDTRADKYEYDSKVIREIKNNRLKFIEVPIRVHYTEYSTGKQHKQGFVNGIKTLARMIWDKFV